MSTSAEQAAGGWARYHAWNKAIADELLGPSSRGRPVYLGLDDDAFRRVSKRAGEPENVDPRRALRDGVVNTLTLPPQTGSLFGDHQLSLLAWSPASADPPPCIALLQFLTSVAQEMQSDEHFRASNYYGRLLAALNLDESYRARISRHFREQTPDFWDALKQWLENHGGEYGVPTAVALGNRRFVGLPISQAVVREQDRKRLPLMFAEYGLQPGQSMPAEELLPYIADWIPHSPVTPALKRLWESSDELQERVAEVAAVELASWDGSLPERAQRTETSSSRLLLAADLRLRPHPSLHFLVTARETTGVTQGLYRVVRGSDGSAADGSNEAHVRLQKIPGFPILAGAAAECAPTPALLYSNLVLQEESAGVGLRWAPRRLLLLKHQPDYNLFVESSRAELLERFLLLAHESIADEVEELVDGAARPGFRRLTPERLRGLPEDWVAFSDVRLVRSPDAGDLRPDLKPLVPAAKTNLAFAGGLGLPGARVWHAKRPPEAQVACIGGQGGLSLTLTAEWQAKQRERREWDLGRLEGGGGIVDLRSAVGSLEPGNYRLRGTSSAGKVVVTATFRLRDGGMPLRIADLPEARIHSVLGEAEGLSTVSAVGGDKTRGKRHVTVIGCEIRLNGREAPMNEGVSSPSQVPSELLTKVAEEELTEPPGPSAGDSARVEPPACFTRGYHYWVCDPMDPDIPREKVRQACRDCGLEQWPEPRRRGRRRAGPAKPATSPQVDARTLPAVTEAVSEASLDLLLDALTYAGAGPWAAFEALAVKFDDSPWFSIELARRLCALGHLELQLDRLSLRPRAWRVTPPGVAIPGSDEPAFLYGARSSWLLDALDREAQSRGVELARQEQPGGQGPSAIKLRYASDEQLAEIALAVEERLGHQLTISDDPAHRLATYVAPLRSLLQDLPVCDLPTTGIERLDLESGQWRSASRVDRRGAYRVGVQPRRYFIADTAADGTIAGRAAEARSAKYLAAALEGKSLVAYKPSTRSLFVPFGAPLPGLFERAAVTESGLLPSPDDRGALIYSSVRPSIAALLWAKTARTGTSTKEKS